MWPAEYEEFKHIENLLVCGICYDYMDTTVITSCSHNYCSLCIRKYLHYKPQCPACFSETFEKDLRKNKALDEIILYFSRVKKKLQSCSEERTSIRNDQEDDGHSTPKAVRKHLSNSPSNKQADKIVEESTTVKNNGSPSSAKNAQKTVNSPSTSGQPNIAQFFTPKSKKEATNTETVKCVMCPVCKVSISEVNINRHLDDCLKRQERKEQIKVEQPKRKPLPKLVFSLMKDTVLRKKLKELGLSSQGDRKVLESRLQKYIILYNAECDKVNPRSVAELIKQYEEDESLEKRVNKTSSSVNKLQINRNSEQNVIDEERKRYLETHKDSFDNLIAKMKNANTSKKPSVRRSLLDNSSNCDINVPQKRQAVDLKEDLESNDFQPLHYDDIDVQASDSDTSCPLQTYSSSDPMTLLNVQLSSSCEGNASQKSTPNRSYQIRRTELESSDESTMVPGDVKVETDECSNFSGLLSCESTNACATPKSRAPLQQRLITFQSTETQSGSPIYKSKPDDSPGLIKLETADEEGEGRSHVQDDFIFDFSSSDSVDVKPNNERSNSTLDGFITKTGTNFCNIEKENINSPSKDNANRGLRKRNRDDTQSNKSPSKSLKEIRKPSRLLHSETDDANYEDHVLSILHETDNGTIQKMPAKKRKQDSQVAALQTKKSPILRKSSRTRLKTRTLLK